MNQMYPDGRSATRTRNVRRVEGARVGRRKPLPLVKHDSPTDLDAKHQLTIGQAVASLFKGRKKPTLSMIKSRLIERLRSLIPRIKDKSNALMLFIGAAGHRIRVAVCLEDFRNFAAAAVS